ncbi:hypothetical protein Ddc_05280 [Ditylenchus destructor]|nr:hypothetical protein Ddc_05280 [Ditylenchus destructor]
MYSLYTHRVGPDNGIVSVILDKCEFAVPKSQKEMRKNRIDTVDCLTPCPSCLPTLCSITSTLNRPTVIRAIPVRSSIRVKKRDHKTNLLKKRNSDPVKLRANFQQFLANDWNRQFPKGRRGSRFTSAVRRQPGTNPAYVSRPRSMSATDLNRVCASVDGKAPLLNGVMNALNLNDINDASAKHRRFPLSAILTNSDRPHSAKERERQDLRAFFAADPDLCRLRQKVERRIERRRSLTHANSAYHGDAATLKTSKVLEKYRPRLLLNRRSVSESALNFMEPNVHIDIGQLLRGYNTVTKGYKDVNQIINLPLQVSGQRKRVSFSGPATTIYVPHFKTTTHIDSITFLQQRQGLLQKPVLSRFHKPAKTILVTNSAEGTKKTNLGLDFSPADEYPLSHMDYATFRAWRRGSRLSIDVFDMFYAEVEKTKDVRRDNDDTKSTRHLIGIMKRVLSGCFKKR